MASNMLSDILMHEEVRAANERLIAADASLAAAEAHEDHSSQLVDDAAEALGEQAAAALPAAATEELARQQFAYIDLAGELVNAKKALADRALEFIKAGLALDIALRRHASSDDYFQAVAFYRDRAAPDSYSRRMLDLTVQKGRLGFIEFFQEFLP
jgi:hypothetical protein